jgi:hypothetical protein
MNGSNATYILDNLGELLDEFLKLFLKANQENCFQALEWWQTAPQRSLIA